MPSRSFFLSLLQTLVLASLAPSSIPTSPQKLFSNISSDAPSLSLTLTNSLFGPLPLIAQLHTTPSYTHPSLAFTRLSGSVDQVHSDWHWRSPAVVVYSIVQEKAALQRVEATVCGDTSASRLLPSTAKRGQLTDFDFARCEDSNHECSSHAPIECERELSAGR